MKFGGSFEASLTQILEQLHHAFVLTAPWERASESYEHIHVAHFSGRFADQDESLEETTNLPVAAAGEAVYDCFQCPYLSPQAMDIFRQRLPGKSRQQFMQLSDLLTSEGYHLPSPGVLQIPGERHTSIEIILTLVSTDRHQRCAVGYHYGCSVEHNQMFALELA